MFKKRKNTSYGNSYFKPVTNNIKIESIINKANDNNRISDNDGLSKAYQASNEVYVNGNKMYIAGTANLRDVWDDITKIPFWGDIKNSERYNQAEAALKDNPQVDTVIGHSLGGSVVAELNKQNNDKFKTTTYGAPFLDFSFKNRTDPNHLSYRHPGDPFSQFDTGAINEENNTINNLVNPHSFSGFPDNDY